MPGYKYRGTNFDVPKEGKPKLTAAFDPSACGTTRGYKQHRRHYQEACAACKRAYADEMAERRRKQAKPAAVFNPDKCGTVAGYSQHRHYKVPLDERCRKANADRCKAQREKSKKGVT